jgi:hypothetical protein
MLWADETTGAFWFGPGKGLNTTGGSKVTMFALVGCCEKVRISRRDKNRVVFMGIL